MKRILLSGWCCLVVVFSAMAEEARSITVTGTHEIELAPDTLKWMFDIHTKAPELEQSKAANDRVLRELLEVLQSRDIPKDQLRVSSIQMGQNYEMRSRDRVPEGFFARRSLVLTTHDVEGYGRLLESVAKVKGLELGHIQRESTRLAQTQSEARLAALEVARIKALAMVKVLNMRLLSPLEIIEGQESGMPYRQRGVAAMAMMESGDVSVELDQMVVRESVTVRFEIAEP